MSERLRSDMVILIGAESCTGKTIMAQRLLEKYQIPYLSIDHLKMGLFLSGNDCGFTPDDDNDVIEAKLWPILKGIIQVNIENRQNIVIEGCYLYPQRLDEIEKSYKEQIIPVFMGFSEDYIRRNFSSKIIRYKGIFEKRDCSDERNEEWFIKAHEKLKRMCLSNNVNFFEIISDYESELQKVYRWIDSEMKLLRVIS